MGRSQGKNPRSVLLGETSANVGARKVHLKLFKNEEKLLTLLKDKYSWQLEEFWQEFSDKLPKNLLNNFQTKLSKDNLFKEFIKNENELLKKEMPSRDLHLDKKYYLGGFNDLATGQYPLGPTALDFFFKQHGQGEFGKEALKDYIEGQIEIARDENDLDNYINWYMEYLKEYLLRHDDDLYGRELMPGEIEISLEAVRNSSLGVTPGGVQRGIFKRMSKVDGFYPSTDFPENMADDNLAYQIAKAAMNEIAYSSAKPAEILKEKANQAATEAIIDHLLAVFEGGYSTSKTFTPTKSRLAQFIVHPNKDIAFNQLRPLAFDKTEEVILDKAIADGLNLPDDPGVLYVVLENTASSIRKDPTMQVIRALVDELKAIS